MRTRELMLGLLIASQSVAQSVSVAGSSSGDVTVLCNDSYLREYLVFRTPVQVSKDGRVSTVMDPAIPKGKTPVPLADVQSSLPSADWLSVEFDDTAWGRRRAPVEVAPEWHGGDTGLHSATVNSMLCLRWKFMVADPAKVKDLKLCMEYVGGVAVYLNGKEVTRANLPAGELKPDAPAEKYPDDLYVLERNKMLQQRWPGEAVKKADEAAFNRRYRKIEGFVVPLGLLRPGGNVLAVEIHRAPINEAAIAAERTMEGAMSTKPGLWAGAGLKKISLVSAAGAGVLPNTARPAGVQVWNVLPFDTIGAFDYGDACDAIKPIAVYAVKNSVFSGRLAVSSGEALKGLKIKVGDLNASGGGKLPASIVSVRAAEPATPDKCWLPSRRFDGLMDAIPAEIPVSKATPDTENYLSQAITREHVTRGAIADIWLTVRVPRDAKAGPYEGVVTVEADGLKSTTIPLHLTVSGWTLADPKDFLVHHFAYHSEDAMAKHYGVPMWSDRHFELMGQSLARMSEINSRQALVNLAINFYGGNKGGLETSNEQSLIRWIKQADGTYKHDFTQFDKYLDMVAKSIGKPAVLRLNCWNMVILADGKLVSGTPGGRESTFSVTRLDPTTGKLDTLEQPLPGTDECAAFWKPVLAEVRKKVEARGWFDVTAMGWNSYCYAPRPEVVSVYHKIWPDGVWSYTAHNGTKTMLFSGTEAGVSMPVIQADSVWTLGKITPRGYRELLKPHSEFWCFTWRTIMRDWSPLTMLRTVPEDELMRGQDGVSDFGADLFPIRSENGRYFCIGNGRGTGGPSCSTQAMLAPGPNGPVATERFEMLREGTELAEAILFVQASLDEQKIAGDLAQRANALLDARGDAFMRNWEAGRLVRDAQLLALAGEIATAIAGGTK